MTDVTWFRSLHYGGNHTVLWWAILPDTRLHIKSELMRSQCIISAFALAIRHRTRALGIDQVLYTVGDKVSLTGRVQKDDWGETRADAFRHNGIPLREITYDPVQGWTRVSELLGVRPDRRPMLTIDPSCTQLIRALTNAVADPSDPESVLDSANDQPLRALRLGAMSRPAPNMTGALPLPKGSAGWLMEELRHEILAGGGSYNSTLAWRSGL